MLLGWRTWRFQPSPRLCGNYLIRFDKSIHHMGARERVEEILESLAAYSAATDTDIDGVAVENLATVLQRLEAVVPESDREREPGRPAIDIPYDVLESYLLQGMTVTAISNLLGVSRQTINRWMAMNGLRRSDMYSTLSVEELDAIITEIRLGHPNTGYRLMKSFLHARGLLVQITRVCESLRRVDPVGNELRAMANRTLRRRQYSVPAPNAMWHIDGNHKLIRWRFVIHGGIDGFSRLIVYLSAATNNQASTVLQSFIGAISRFGLPSPVRSDKGGENIEVAQFMVEQRGLDRHSHITGRSVHNQRIERLWRDVYIQVLDAFHVLFHNLEREGLLNPDDERDLFALHWAFLPQLQRQLTFFMDAWNHHGMRTTGSRSPLQLWTSARHPEDPDQVEADYGVDWDGPHDFGDLGGQAEHVEVPQVQHHLTEENIANLPDPDVPFVDALAIYTATRQQLTE